ncbi:MAG: branched-chain amino acid ABC transporter permease [Deltaproteobacteria bacterium]|nr:branched-chain amino acid ABC transporter permease [Deltaproteobacteria bacterium]
MTLITLVNQFISGATYGLVLFMVALGLALIFGVMSIVNLAHGSLYMLGAFFGYFIWSALRDMQFSFWLSVLLAGLGVAAAGFILEYLLRPFYRRGHTDQILFTYAFMYIIADLVKMFWGGRYYTLPRPPGLEGSLTIAGIILPTYNLFIIGVSLSIAALLWFLLARTKLGKIIRAAVFDREMVGILGIRLPWLFALVFGIGAFVAGAVGLLAAPMGSIAVGMDVEIIVPVFVVCIIGGMGSFLGALIASLIIGEVYAFGILVLPQVAMAFMFLVVIVILIIRPQGLFGRPQG